MDSCSTRVKPSIPPKPKNFSLSKCKSVSSYINNIRSNNRITGCRSNEVISPHPSCSDSTTPNEDVFNSGNMQSINYNNNNNIGSTLGVSNKIHFNASGSHFVWKDPSNHKMVLTLPTGCNPKFGNVQTKMYRSGGTMNIVTHGRSGQTRPTAVEEPKPHRTWSEFFDHDPIDLGQDVQNCLENFVPLNSSFVSDSSSPDHLKNTSFDPMGDDTKTDQVVDTNNNINVSSITNTSESLKADNTDGVDGKTPHGPPLARFSIRRRPPPLLPPCQRAASSASTLTPFQSSLQLSASTSNSSFFNSKEQEASRDNLDVLIPVIAKSSSASRDSRKFANKSKGQSRAQSECSERMTKDFNGREIFSTRTDGNVDSGTHSKTIDDGKNMIRRPKPKPLYLPMSKVEETSRRNYTSCMDLVHQQHHHHHNQLAKFGRVKTLINENTGVERKQAVTLPWSSKPPPSPSLSLSVTSSSIASDHNPLESGSSLRVDGLADGVESHDNNSSSSSDNYGTLSNDDDDDDDDEGEKYVSRDDIQSDEGDSKRSTLNDDVISGCCKSFESNNEIKSLRLSGVVQTSSPLMSASSTATSKDLSSSLFFLSSDASSAASSSLSLDALQSDRSTRSTEADVEGIGPNYFSPSPQLVTIKGTPKDPFLVAKEIMTSEESFIGVLKLLNEEFPNFIQSERALGRVTDGPSDAKQLMHDLPNLQEVNKELLKQLKQRLENWDTDPRIADIFVRTGHFLKLYTNYIKNFSQIVQEFDNLRKKNPEFDKAVTEFETSPACNKLALKHYMLKPIQRIPQYKLLLQEYLKCLLPNSPDYKNAKEAIPIVAGVSEHANESVRNWENQTKMIQIQSMLQGGFQIIKPDRRFIKEGRLMKLSRKEMQARMFFLFNDLLLYTTPIGTNSFKVNQAISLDGLTVNCSTTEDTENEFSIISVERSFTVAASSKEERQQWVLALEMAVLDHVEIKANLEEAIKQRRCSVVESSDQSAVGSKPLNSRAHLGNGAISMYESGFRVGERAPVWIQDERASMCMACTREFSVTFRRHHCRGCGKIVCSNCSKCRAPLKYNGNKIARVCVDCFETLKLSARYDEEDSWQANDSASDAPSECLITIRDFTPGSRSPAAFGKRGLSVLFKGKNASPGARHGLSKPSIFTEVQAFDSSSELSGFLLKLEKKKWKRFWFVLKNSVLYTFKAMQDKAAIRTMPLLSYNVQDGSSGTDNDEKTFEIFHDGLPPITLRAETCALKLKWIDALRKAMAI